MAVRIGVEDLGSHTVGETVGSDGNVFLPVWRLYEDPRRGHDIIFDVILVLVRKVGYSGQCDPRAVIGVERIVLVVALWCFPSEGLFFPDFGADDVSYVHVIDKRRKLVSPVLAGFFCTEEQDAKAHPLHRLEVSTQDSQGSEDLNESLGVRCLPHSNLGVKVELWAVCSDTHEHWVLVKISSEEEGKTRDADGPRLWR